MATAPTGRDPKSLDGFVLWDASEVFRDGDYAELMTDLCPPVAA